MSKVYDVNEKKWEEWVSTRPEIIQKMCRKYPPNLLYKMKGTGSRVTLVSYSEDGTVTVEVSGKYNRCDFERNVFGINPKDLEECELPGNDEVLGAIITDPEDVESYIDIIRPLF